MNQPRHEVAGRFVTEVCEAAGEVAAEIASEVAEGVATAQADQAVAEHEERMHVPIRDMSPLTAVPFPEESIPDPHLKQMVEMMEREGFAEGAAAAAMGYPLTLAHRELSRYYARHERLCQEWALP